MELPQVLLVRRKKYGKKEKFLKRKAVGVREGKKPYSRKEIFKKEGKRKGKKNSKKEKRRKKKMKSLKYKVGVQKKQNAD